MTGKTFIVLRNNSNIADNNTLKFNSPVIGCCSAVIFDPAFQNGLCFIIVLCGA